MTTKPVNFNDLKGDNLTEIVSYLHPHTEENKRLKGELKKYMEFEKCVKQFIDREYEREDLTDIPHKRKFPRKKIKLSGIEFEEIEYVFDENIFVKNEKGIFEEYDER